MNYIDFLDIDEIGNGNSFFHKLHPLNKILLLILFYLVIFSFGILVKIISISILIILLYFTNMKHSTLIKIFITTLFFLVSFEILIFLIDLNNKVYLTIKIFIRLLSMILPIVLYSNITTLKETVYSITKIISPIRHINIGLANIIELCLTLIITYIPILLLEFDRIFLIKASKGEDIKNSSFMKKINIIYTSLFPVVVQSFIKAEQMIDSIVVRGYDKDIKRTTYITYNIDNKNKIVIIAQLLIITMLIANNIILIR